MNIFKKLLLPFLLIVLINCQGQSIDTVKIQPKEKYWNFFGISNFNFNQISFSNWVTGGENAFSGTVGLSVNANYKKSNLSFENSGIFKYGMIDDKYKGLMKMEDKIDIDSKLNYKAVKYWNYSILFSFNSQFSKGYNYPNRVDEISRFFAPAYFILSAGTDYQPNKNFDFFISPVSGKFTFVLDQKLADLGSYGVRKATFDTISVQGYKEIVINHGETIKSEFGISINTKVRYSIMKNIMLDSRLVLYDNYMENIHNKWNIDVNLETNINFVINRVFSTTFNFNFLYDDNILIPLYKVVNGTNIQIGQGPRLQSKESFGIGMIIKLGQKEKK